MYVVRDVNSYRYFTTNNGFTEHLHKAWMIESLPIAKFVAEQYNGEVCEIKLEVIYEM